jgi:hypothetical protein
MRIRRTFPIALAVVVVGAAVTLAVQLRKHAPPEPARLLPGADAFIYADFAWARRANGGKLVFPGSQNLGSQNLGSQSPGSQNPSSQGSVAHDPEYERFIQETGFDFERDLDAVAFAVHYPQSWPGGGTGGAAPEPRFSEVFTGRFDGSKCLAYLKRTAQSVETYNSIDIFTIPLYGRSFRIAVLGVDTVAASNHDDPAVIRGMVDRSRRLASPFGGPALLRRYYKRVQLASPVWLVARVEPASPGFEAWSSVFPKPADLVISASYNPLHLPLHAGVLHLRAEAWTATDEDAHNITDKANVYLAMFRSAEVSVGSVGTDADVKAVFESLQVRQEGNRAVLSAILPSGVFRKLGESPDQILDPEQPAAVAPPGKTH